MSVTLDPLQVLGEEAAVAARLRPRRAGLGCTGRTGLEAEDLLVVGRGRRNPHAVVESKRELVLENDQPPPGLGPERKSLNGLQVGLVLLDLDLLGGDDLDQMIDAPRKIFSQKHHVYA